MALTKISRDRLATCHPDLEALVLAVARVKPVLVVCGHRGKEEQNECFDRGVSSVCWPKSKHNALPSRAVDLAPIPLDWKNLRAFIDLGALVLATAKRLKAEGKITHDIVWGGNWIARDFPHYELSSNEGDTHGR